MAGPLLGVCVLLPVRLPVKAQVDPTVVPDTRSRVLRDVWPRQEVRDSKKAGEAACKRLVPALLAWLAEVGGTVGVGRCSPARRIAIGEKAALAEAMSLAVKDACEQAGRRPDLLLVDGRIGVDGYPDVQRICPEADGLFFPVALASMIARALRDDQMRELGAQHPGWGLASHKGYLTPPHVQRLKEAGDGPLSPAHLPALAGRALARIEARKTAGIPARRQNGR